jgi:hypothetical protein
MKNLVTILDKFSELMIDATLDRSIHGKKNFDDIPELFRPYVVQYVTTDATYHELLASFLNANGWLAQNYSTVYKIAYGPEENRNYFYTHSYHTAKGLFEEYKEEYAVLFEATLLNSAENIARLCNGRPPEVLFTYKILESSF